MPLNNRNQLLYIILSLLCLILTACSEFIEYPLEKKHIELLAPSENYQTTDTIIKFWWTEHQDAKFYRLQIVKPNFLAPDKLIIDSIVYENKLTLKLDTGRYGWRVRPENNGSAGVYAERLLHIITP